MKSDHFERPVIILTGLGHPTVISSAMEAYVFLADWPISKRDPSHYFAMKSSLAAARGEIEAETARGAFTAFAEWHDILASAAVAFRATVKSARGPRGVAR